MKGVIGMNDFDDLIQQFKELKVSIVELEQMFADSITSINSKMREFTDSLEEKFVQTSDDFVADDDIETDAVQEKYITEFANGKRGEKFVWYKTLPPNTSKIKYYSSFVELLLNLNPINIRIPMSITPVISFYDGFVRSDEIPLGGNFVLGSVNGIPVIVDINLKDTVLLKTIDEEVISVTVKD